MLPIVAATISRRIEGCFGGTPACNVSAVMLASQTWFKRNLVICLSLAHAEARADNPRFQVVAGSFAHSKLSAKINLARPGTVPARLPLT
jgi:hypothetical protein